MQNQIPENWQLQPLNFFTRQVTYGFTNPMPEDSSGPYMITAKDIIDGEIDYDTCRKTSVSAYEKLLTDKSRPELDDILLTKDGTLGRVGIVTKVPLCINQSVALIKSNKDKIVPKFLKYLLESPQYQAKMLADSGGSTIGHIYITRVDKMEILVPTKPEQNRIVNQIDALSKKININNKIVKTLEEIAQVLFKEWFVKFKFPGYEKVEFVNSALGKIPEGWEIKKVSDVIKRLPFGNVYIEDKIIKNGVIPIYDQSSDKILGYHNNKPDFEASIETPYGIFGDHTCRMKLLIHPFSVGPNVVPFIAKNNYPTVFTYFMTINSVKQREYKRHWIEFSEKEYVIPKIETAKNFAEVIEANLKKTDLINLENQKLTALRDLLLPKLMKGEIRV